MANRKPILALTLAATALAVTAVPADARCTRLGFSVNDYGKEGPTNDAKRLLDKYIAEWTAKHGITKYTVGKKDVTCELFLDFGFFDEHTCKATASVCWEGNAGPPASAATEAGVVQKKAPPKAKAADPAAPASPTATTPAPKAKATPAAAAPGAAPKAPDAAPKAPAKKKADEPA